MDRRNVDRRNLSKVLLAGAAGAIAAASPRAMAQTCTAPCYPVESYEDPADIVDRSYPPLDVRRYGAVINSESTVAFVRAMKVAKELRTQIYVPPTGDLYFRLSGDVLCDPGTGARIDGAIFQTTRNKNIFIAADDCTFDGTGLLIGDGGTSGEIEEKNSGIFAKNVVNLRVQGLRFSLFQNGAIQLRNCRDYKIIGNTITDGVAGSRTYPEADILVYSLSANGARGLRGIISHNHCLSNNDIGIYYDANGWDLDQIISDNVCVTLSNGVEATNGGSRRHGILCSYGGGASGRHLITGNICRNTRITGIYRTGATVPSLSVIITSNVCSSNGYETASAGVNGGIYIGNYGPGDIIANNTIDDFRGSLRSTNAAININGGTDLSATSRLLVQGNTITNSQGNGLVLIGHTSNVDVKDNVFYNNYYEDIVVNNAGGAADAGGHVIRGNRISRPNNTASAIYLNLDNAGKCTLVQDNVAGASAVVDGEGSNPSNGDPSSSFLYLTLYSARVLIERNYAERFYYGVYMSNVLGPGRTINQIRIDDNDFRNMNTGIRLPRATLADCCPVCGNKFIDVGFPVAEGAYKANRRMDNLVELLGVVPGSGTWATGDRVLTLGSMTPGAVCTAGGNPGTWKSMPSLLP